MNKKGFTLIELLAVIVILAIIALIATPAVLNIIEDSKLSAAKDSASVIAKAAETYYISQTTLQGKEVGDIDLTTDTLEYKGSKPEKGYVTFDDKGNSYVKMYTDGYCIISDFDNSVVAEKMDSDECTMANEIILEPFNDGDVVFYNPVANTTCEEGSKNCLRWYAFLDTKEAPTVKLLLDHNVLNEVAWDENWGDTNFDLTKRTSLDEIDLATEGWSLMPRFLKAVEVHEIAQKYAATVENYGEEINNFNVKDGETSYWFTTGEWGEYYGEEPHPLGWLYDNLMDCTFSGCNVEDNNSSSEYWLEEIDDRGMVWTISRDGSLRYSSPDYGFNGFRPVIEVEKTKFLSTYEEVVTINTGGGKLLEIPPKYKVGKAFTTLPEVTRRGHTFLGWYDKSGNQITSDTIVVKGMTITARWQVNTYTITFRNEGTVVKTQTVTYGQPYGTLLAPTKEGYNFLGWKVDKDMITADTIVTTTKDHEAITIFVEITYLAKLYFNPITNSKCSSDDYTWEVNSKNGFRGTTDNGCMLWYAYKEENGNYLMILDHNTSTSYSIRSTAQTQIENAKNNNLYGWHADVRSTIRLITAEEINEIAPDANGTWSPAGGAYYLHSGTGKDNPNEKGMNKYAWLIDNLEICYSFGCNVEQEGQSGYWTTTDYEPTSLRYGWCVFHGKLNYTHTAHQLVAGTRPVISVPKTKFTN